MYNFGTIVDLNLKYSKEYCIYSNPSKTFQSEGKTGFVYFSDDQFI